MNKTDKVFYNGFAVVAIASIVVMLVSVFSSRQNKKQKKPSKRLNDQPTLESATPGVAQTQIRCADSKQLRRILLG